MKELIKEYGATVLYMAYGLIIIIAINMCLSMM